MAVSVGVWAFFGIQERLNRLETAEEIMKKAIEHEVSRLQDGIDIIRTNEVALNTDFRIRWPRGEMGSLPADSEQFMMIEHLSSELEANGGH